MCTASMNAFAKGRRGLAIAEAVDGRCSACHMTIRLQFFQDLKKGDQVMNCESCSRILFHLQSPNCGGRPGLRVRSRGAGLELG